MKPLAFDFHPYSLDNLFIGLENATIRLYKVSDGLFRQSTNHTEFVTTLKGKKHDYAIMFAN